MKGYAGMPVSGKFLVCQNPEIIEKNKSKVYGQPAVGSPPMSVPHLDWRTIYGKDCIFFGPFAGFSPTIFKKDSHGSDPRRSVGCWYSLSSRLRFLRDRNSAISS